MILFRLIIYLDTEGNFVSLCSCKSKSLSVIFNGYLTHITTNEHVLFIGSIL